LKSREKRDALQKNDSLTQNETHQNMKHILKTTLILAAIALAGCSDEKSRDFFARGGITIGAPAALGSGSYQIPIEFETEIVHSGQWIDTVDAEVAGADILVTASFTSSNRKGSLVQWPQGNRDR
jgi:hypothetical protein